MFSWGPKDGLSRLHRDVLYVLGESGEEIFGTVVVAVCGDEPSETERERIRDAVRELASLGLVAIDGDIARNPAVTLTEAGRSRLV